jgi:hypothetical protein
MAKVHVWLGPGWGGIGHAALLLDRVTPSVYISWWPSGTKKKLLQTAGHFTPTFESDVKEEYGNPHAIVSLKCLREDLIANWWQQVKLRGAAIPFAPNLQPYSNNYDFLGNNCSTIVLKALEVGCGVKKVFKMATPQEVLLQAGILRARESLNTSPVN